MSDNRAEEAAERIDLLLGRIQQLQVRLSRLPREGKVGVPAAQRAADVALEAALDALRYSGEAHAKAAKAHRDFAKLLESRGQLEQAKAHRDAAAADDAAAAADLGRLAGWEDPRAEP